MIRLAWRGLAARRVATALAAAGLLTAVAGFLVLTGVSRTTQAVLSGDIARAWTTPYDLLVRPTGSESSLEATQGLVRPNFLSGTTGGITMAQLDAIRATPGVTVAAPIAVVGTVLWPAAFPVDLTGLIAKDGVTVLRVTLTATGEAGLSTYPALPPTYLVAAPSGRVVQQGSTPGAASYLEVDGTRIECTPRVVCYGGETPGAGEASLAIRWPIPIVVAGIDPVAEAKLTGLDRCVTSGRDLTSSDIPAMAMSPAGDQPTIPVLVSTRSFLDEDVHISVARSDSSTAVLGGSGPDAVVDWSSVAEERAPAEAAYQAYLATLLASDYYDASPHWTTGAVNYRQIGPDHLEALPMPPDPAVYQSQTTFVRGAQSASLAPPEAGDVWLRSVDRHDQELSGELFSRWTPVGEYDPDCLPGFDPLAGGTLEAYGLPSVTLADGQTLGPTRSLASYVNSPPLVLTTLSGAAWLDDPSRFEGAPGQAFISAVRVQVARVEEPDAAAEARLAQAAAAIHDVTGLRVDVVKGSSPRQVLVDLPAGRYGRPAVTVAEGWSQKGVAVVFVEAVAAQDLALFLLDLVGGTLLVAATAHLIVRQRQPELATLRAIGWSRWRLAWLVEAEILVLGLAVGVAALAGVALVLPLGVVLAPWQLFGAVPLSVSIAGLAGLVPALLVLRGPPVERLMAVEPGHTGGPVRSTVGLAMRDLTGPRRVESLLGALAVGLGGAMLGIVGLVVVAFDGRLDLTVLGVYLGAQVRPFHVAVACLTLAVGALTAGEVVTLGYLRRATAFATLRAVGWSARRITGILLLQAAAIGLAGGVPAALATLAVGQLLGASSQATAAAAVTALSASAVASLAAGSGPALLARRGNLASILRGE